MKAGTGAVVVAAGLSSRMKTFKPLLPLGDSTIIRTVLSTLRSAGASALTVVAGYRADSLREHIADFDATVLVNEEYATTDMFHSARLGLSAMKDKVDRLFFLPGDVPLFAGETLSLMLETMDESGAPVVIPAYRGRNGHPLLLHNGILAALVAYEGGGGMKAALAAVGPAMRVVDVDDPGVLLDVDDEEGYLRIVRYEEKIRSLKRAARR